MIKNKIKYCALLGVLALGFSSCLKDKPFLDVSNTQAIAEFSIVSPTVATYSWGALPADTAEIDTAIAVDIASPQTLNYDVTLTVNWDTTLITAYNANAEYPLTALPDSDFSMTLPATIKIPAGYRIGRIPVKLFVNKIDPKTSYAMPLTITAVTTSNNGAAPLISGNAKSIMYAFIGNPIAGPYNQEWIRYNTAAATGTPAYDQQLGISLFTPVTPVEVTAPSGTGVTYDITFTSTNGVPDPGSFGVTLTAASVTAAGITISAGPTIITADPVNGVYKFNFQYLNSAGAPRNITDIFTR